MEPAVNMSRIKSKQKKIKHSFSYVDLLVLAIVPTSDKRVLNYVAENAKFTLGDLLFVVVLLLVIVYVVIPGTLRG